MEVKFVKPTDADILHVAEHMRIADVEEIWAASGMLPDEALFKSLEMSTYCLAVLFDDEPVAIMGLNIIDLLTGTGCPWLLATHRAMRYKRAFLELSPPIIEEMLTICPNLYNYVHAKNRTSVRWLRWLGFEFEPAQPFGVQGELFHRFYRTRGH